MAFGFFGRKKKNQQHASGDNAEAAQKGSGTGADSENQSGEKLSGDSTNKPVERDPSGKLTASDFLPDADLPQLNRSRANMLRDELEYRFSLQDAHINIEGNSAMVQRADGGAAHVSLRTLAMNAAGLENFDQLPDLVESFVHGTLADATLNDLSTAELYKSLRLRLLATPGANEEVLEDNSNTEIKIRDDSILRSFTSDTSIALVLDTEHAIRIQPLAELERFDDLEALERAADRNTWQDLYDAKVDATFVDTEKDGEGASFWAFESSSYYLGSAPLFLSDLLHKWAPELDQSDGVIFAVPDRDLLIARAVSTGENLMNGITAMVRTAMRFGLGNPTSISPRLHMLHENQVTTFTDFRVISKEMETEWAEQSIEGPPAGAIGIEVRPDAYLMERLQQDGFGDFGDFGTPRDLG